VLIPTYSSADGLISQSKTTRETQSKGQEQRRKMKIVREDHVVVYWSKTARIFLATYLLVLIVGPFMLGLGIGKLLCE